MRINISKKELAYGLIVNLPWIEVLFAQLYYTYFYQLVLFFALVYLVSRDKTKYTNRALLILGFIEGITLILELSHILDLPNIYNQFFKYVNIVLLFIHFSSHKRCYEFYKFVSLHLCMLKVSIYIVLFVDGILLFVPAGYEYSWLGQMYKGTSYMPHTAAYLMFSTLITLLFLYKYEQSLKYIIIAIVPFVTILLTGARVVFLTEFLMLYLYVDAFFKRTKCRMKFLRFLKIVTVLAFMVVLVYFLAGDRLMNSNMMRKFALRSSAADATAGRSVFWVKLMDKYLYDSSIVQYLFGYGDDFVFVHNYKIVGTYIWAHNDLIQIIVGKGLLSLIIYLSVTFKSIINSIRFDRRITTWLMWLCIIMLGLVNGFYSYQMSLYILPMFLALQMQFSKDNPHNSPQKKI